MNKIVTGTHDAPPRECNKTGSYLTDSGWTEAMNLGVTFNELVSHRPTNPHVTRLWEVMLLGHTFNWTTPDRVFHNTNTRDYFQRLVRFQSSNPFIEPRDLSKAKNRKLVAMINRTLEACNRDSNVILPERQVLVFKSIIKLLSKEITISPRELAIDIGGDNELIVSKTSSDGSHMIVVGDTDADVSYVFISNTPGLYSSIHLDDNNTLGRIIDTFVAA